MLKGRIEKIEKRVKVVFPQKKKLKVWTVTVDENNPEIKDTNEEAQRLIEEIKTGKVKHEDGSYYSEEDAHLFLINIIPTNKDSLEDGQC